MPRGAASAQRRSSRPHRGGTDAEVASQREVTPRSPVPAPVSVAQRAGPYGVETDT